MLALRRSWFVVAAVLTAAAGPGCGGRGGIGVTADAMTPSDGGAVDASAMLPLDAAVPEAGPDAAAAPSPPDAVTGPDAAVGGDAADPCGLAWAPAKEDTSGPAQMSQPERLVQFGGPAYSLAFAADGEVFVAARPFGAPGTGLLYGWRPGQTSAREIAQTPVAPAGLAFTGDKLVWYRSYSLDQERTFINEVRAVARAGGQPEQVWTRTTKGRSMLRRAGASLLVSLIDGDSFVVLELTPGGGERELLRLSGRKMRPEFAVDDRTFFLMEAGAGAVASRLFAVDRSTKSAIELGEGTAVTGLRAQGGFVYYATEEPDGTQSIRRVHRSGTCAVRLLTLPKDSQGATFVVRDDRLIWESARETPNDLGGGRYYTRLGALDLRTGRQSVPFAAATSVGTFELDATHLYLTENVGRMLIRIPGL